MLLPVTVGSRGRTLTQSMPGAGWFNAPPHQMVSFFRLANQILNVNYPERAQRLIICRRSPWSVGTYWAWRAGPDCLPPSILGS